MTLKMVSVFLVIFGAFSISAQTNRNGRELMENSANARPRISSQSSGQDEVKKIIVELDRAYQEAVKNNDAKTMARILADDFVLVTGKGKVFSKEDLLKEAREGKTIYERQEDSEQIVRVWGDTAVITALLWVKGTSAGKSFEYRLWFSDVYKRTPNGWRYVFAQAAQPLAKEP
jgi:ketosteroid isomerase-like protein